ncbi:MAG TPA: hypothetical protein VNM37_08755 [Candidatus Dormibacteraeota bacterium]|nr:hypothetical protein [Candidatus Dormibacteraeota bacterium]
MANTQNAFGLRPKTPLHGADWNGKIRHFYAPSTYGTALFIGDPVIITGTSNTAAVETMTGKWVVGALAEVNIATAGSGNKITGIITGFLPVTRDSTVHGTASTERVIEVCVDPFMVYEVQGGATALAATTVGLDAVLKSGTGSTVTGRSGWFMDSGDTTAPAANAAYQVHIINGSNIEGNDVASAYATWDVIINIPSYANGVAGV